MDFANISAIAHLDRNPDILRVIAVSKSKTKAILITIIHMFHSTRCDLGVLR